MALGCWPLLHMVKNLLLLWIVLNRHHAYDIIISLRPHLGAIGLRVYAVVSDVPAADHKRVQGNGFVPQHDGAMTSMHKVYYTYYNPLKTSPEYSGNSI